MAEFAKPTENGKPNSPPPAAQPVGEFQRDADVVQEIIRRRRIVRCHRQDASKCCPTRRLQDLYG